jgi:hypothetical protein
VDDASETDFGGAVVVISCVADLYTVCLDPPPPGGSHPHTTTSKNEAYAVAREMWTQFKCGLRDESDKQTGNKNAGRSQLT